MPKQVWKITQFHGGLNNNSDPRDIADSELAAAKDIMVDELGKIRMMGGINASTDPPNNEAAIEPGYGLFQFSHDRREGGGGGGDGASASEEGDDYLAMADVATSQIDIYSKDEDAWGTNKIDLGDETSGMKAVFYAADGTVRVSDGSFGANNVSRWYGYIYREDTRHPHFLTEIDTGTELISDADDQYMTTDTGNWTAFGSFTTVSVDSTVANKIQVAITATTAGQPLAHKGVELAIADLDAAPVIGKKYRIQGQLESTAGLTTPKIYFGIGGGYELVEATDGNPSNGTISTAEQTFTADVVAINTTGGVRVINAQGVAVTFTVDAMTVKEVGASAGTISEWKVDNQFPSAPSTDGTTLVQKNQRANTNELPIASQFDIDSDVSLTNALTFRVDSGEGAVVEIFALDNINYDVNDSAKNYSYNVVSSETLTHSGSRCSPYAPYLTSSTFGRMTLLRSSNVGSNEIGNGWGVSSVELLPDCVTDGIGGEDNVLEIRRNQYHDGSSWNTSGEWKLDSGTGVSGDNGAKGNSTHGYGGNLNGLTCVCIGKNISDPATPVFKPEIPWNGGGEVYGGRYLSFDIYVTAGHPILDATNGGLGIRMQRKEYTYESMWFGDQSDCLDAHNDLKLIDLVGSGGWNIIPDTWSTITICVDGITGLGNEIYVGPNGWETSASGDVNMSWDLWSGMTLIFSHPVDECTWSVGTIRSDKHLYLKNFRIESTQSGTATGANALRFFYSWKYDGISESPLSRLGTEDWAYNPDYLANKSFSMHVKSTSLDLNERITGASVYFKQVGQEDEDGNVYKLADFDFQKGYKLVTGDYTEFDNGSWDVSDGLASPTITRILSTGDIPFPTTLPAIFTYEMETGHEADETDFSVMYATAVVANRTAYIGNVQYDGQIFGDKILKSAVNQFDNFPKTNTIEASIADGDEIIKLEEYADRLLQFKKNKMQLINISQEIEFLEDTFMHKGVSHPAATCKTDFGIAWVNKQGCYLYDGQKVSNLLEKQGRQIIKESTWATFTALEPMIGYIPKKRQLLIANDVTTSGTGATYLYDMVTQSWVEGAAATVTSEDKTNFTTDWNGDLIYAHTDGTGAVVKWDDDGDDSTGMQIRTKDIDFGEPGLLKNVYKVHVSYKGDASGTTVGYSVNGVATLSYTFINPVTGNSDPTPLADESAATDWEHAELVPTTASLAKNIYSFKVHFLDVAADDFEINDISIIYRLKGKR